MGFPIAPCSSQMSPEDTHKPIRIYIRVLKLGVSMFFCFFKLFVVVGNDSAWFYHPLIGLCMGQVQCSALGNVLIASASLTHLKIIMPMGRGALPCVSINVLFSNSSMQNISSGQPQCATWNFTLQSMDYNIIITVEYSNVLQGIYQ